MRMLAAPADLRLAVSPSAWICYGLLATLSHLGACRSSGHEQHAARLVCV
jgi:hypothetical protein